MCPPLLCKLQRSRPGSVVPRHFADIVDVKNVHAKPMRQEVFITQEGPPFLQRVQATVPREAWHVLHRDSVMGRIMGQIAYGRNVRILFEIALDQLRNVSLVKHLHILVNDSAVLFQEPYFQHTPHICLMICVLFCCCSDLWQYKVFTVDMRGPKLSSFQVADCSGDK